MLHPGIRARSSCKPVRIAVPDSARWHNSPLSCALEDTFVKGEILQRLSRETEQLKTQGLFKPERVLSSRAERGRARRRRRRSRQPVRQQLPRAGQRRFRARSRAARARPLRLRHGVGALHLRHAGDPQGARSAAEPLPRHRGHDPLFVVLRCERRPVRDAARRAGRGDQRRAESREHHRRRAPLQSAALPLRQQRPRRAGSAPEGSEQVPRAPDRDRRRVLDGRRDRAPQGRSATSPTATTRW